MCESDPERKLMYCATNKKASTNYAVTLERLGKRDQARSYMNGFIRTMTHTNCPNYRYKLMIGVFSGFKSL